MISCTWVSSLADSHNVDDHVLSNSSIRLYSFAVSMSPVFFPLSAAELNPLSQLLSSLASMKLCSGAFICVMMELVVAAYTPAAAIERIPMVAINFL